MIAAIAAIALVDLTVPLLTDPICRPWNRLDVHPIETDPLNRYGLWIRHSTPYR